MKRCHLFFPHRVCELDLKVNHGGKIIFADNLAKLDQYAPDYEKYWKTRYEAPESEAETGN